jgi:hypothetical protein
LSTLDADFHYSQGRSNVLFKNQHWRKVNCGSLAVLLSLTPECNLMVSASQTFHSHLEFHLEKAFAAEASCKLFVFSQAGAFCMTVRLFLSTTSMGKYLIIARENLQSLLIRMKAFCLPKVGIDATASRVL